MSRIGVLTSWRRVTGAASAAAVAFCLLACGCALVAVAGPRASAQLRTNAFHQLVRQTPAADKTVQGTTDGATFATALGGTVNAQELTLTQSELREKLRSMPLAPAGTEWASLTAPFAGFEDRTGLTGSDGTQLELVYRDPLSRYVKIAAGTLPGGSVGNQSSVTVQAAVTAATAHRFGLKVGSRVKLLATGITLRMSGIVIPRDPGSPFWTTDAIAAAPVLVQPAQGEPYWQGAALIPAAALAVLQSRFTTTDIQVLWTLPVTLSGLTATQALTLGDRMPGLLDTAGQLNEGYNGVDISLTSSIPPLLTGFAAQYSAAGDVLDLIAVSLAVVGAAVLLMAAWLMAERRQEEFAVLRARGASRRQLALAAFGGSAVAALPGAAVGIAVAIAVTPGAGTPLAWWLAGLTVAAALAGPVLITIRVHRGAGGIVRPDRRPARLSSARRLIVEAMLVAASIGGVVVLRDQGNGSGDLYASAAPILVAIPVAIIMLRLYPLVVRLLLALASRRSSVTAFLGLARAARVSATAVLPAFAMVLALSLVSFAVMVRAAVDRGEVTQSWQQAGADAVISQSAPITPAHQRAIAALPGVTSTATFASIGTLAGPGLGVDLVFANPARYAALLAATPLTPPPAEFAHWSAATASRGSPVPVLASSAVGLGHRITTLQLETGSVRIQVVGPAPAMSQTVVAGGSAGYLVLPSSLKAAAAAAPDILLVAGHPDAAALQAAVAGWHVHGATVTLRSALLAGLQRAPLQRGAYNELALGGVAAAVGCLLVLLLTLLLSAQSRQATLARVATMGLSAAQARSLALVEALPQILSVLIGGLVCALVLAPLVGPSLSLAVFTDSPAGVSVRIEPAWLALTAVVLLVLALVTLAGQTTLASRQLARSLRIGG